METGALMGFKWFYAGCVVVWFIPFLALMGIVLHFCLARIRQRQRQQTGRRGSRLCACGLALGLAFVQWMRPFYTPGVACVLAAKEDADEDESGDPDTLESRRKHFHSQLRRVRRGDPVDRLVWRM